MGAGPRGIPYSPLGRLLDELASGRGVSGPYNIAYFVGEAIAYEVSGQAVSKYLYGKSLPGQAFIEAFADAFELTPEERTRLAWIYTYESR